MKIKKIKNSKYNLFKLKLIQFKIYKAKVKNLSFDNSLNIILEHIELHFKKMLQIIYEYHINNKQILFIGVPNFLQKNLKKILKKTNHLLIPETLMVNGIVSNKSVIFRNFNLKHFKNIEKQKYNNYDVNLLLKIAKKSDLIIIFNRNLDLNVIKEIYKLRIPIISLNNVLYFDLKSTCVIQENFTKANQQFSNLFFLVLYSIFKKPFGKLS